MCRRSAEYYTRQTVLCSLWTIDVSHERFRKEQSSPCRVGKHQTNRHMWEISVNSGRTWCKLSTQMTVALKTDTGLQHRFNVVWSSMMLGFLTVSASCAAAPTTITEFLTTECRTVISIDLYYLLKMESDLMGFSTWPSKQKQVREA